MEDAAKVRTCSLISLPLIEGVAGAVTVLVEGQSAPRETLMHAVTDEAQMESMPYAFRMLKQTLAFCSRI